MTLVPEEPPPLNAGPERFEPASKLKRRQPTWWQSTLILAGVDLASLWRSWLCRGFFLVSAVVTVIALKGMQAEEANANLMLEVVYTTYLIVWMHAVIFIAGGALMREQDCLTEAILSRGVTRGEYIGAKLIARSAAILVMVVGVLGFARTSGTSRRPAAIPRSRPGIPAYCTRAPTGPSWTRRPS
jgi:hypothetical protein